MHHTWRARAGLGVRTSTYNANKKRAPAGVESIQDISSLEQLITKAKKEKRSSGVFRCRHSQLVPSSKDGREGEAGLHIKPQKGIKLDHATIRTFCPLCPFFAFGVLRFLPPFVSPCQATFLVVSSTCMVPWHAPGTWFFCNGTSCD